MINSVDMAIELMEEALDHLDDVPGKRGDALYALAAQHLDAFRLEVLEWDSTEQEYDDG